MKEKDLINTIYNTAEVIKNGRTPTSVFLSISEEVGELAKELNVKYQESCYKTGDEDGILGESCDVLIGVIDLLFLEGHSREEILSTLESKLSKWKSKTNGGSITKDEFIEWDRETIYPVGTKLKYENTKLKVMRSDNDSCEKCYFIYKPCEDIYCENRYYEEIK